MNRKSLVFWIFLFILITVTVLVGNFFYKFKSIKDKIFVGSTNIQTTSNLQSIADHFNSKTPINILLLGYGGGSHDGAYLTDSMIVVHIDPATKKVTLISVPRDIWVKIPTNGDKGSYWKINAAYELGLDDTDYSKKQDQFKGLSGGGNLAKYVVGQVTGLNIDRFIAMDFAGFRKTIDTLGGVDINVETTFDDFEYPIDGKEDDLCGHSKDELPDLEKIATISATQAFPCRYLHLHFDQGLTHMDGEKALEYVRSRHSLQDGTDFGRSKRQRNLLVAVKQKVFNIGFIPKALSFSSSLQDDFRTDLSLSDLKTIVDKANELNQYQVSNLALTDQNVLKDDFSDDGQAILYPKDGLDNWTSTQSWISSALANGPILSPTIKVENSTNVQGLATLAYNRLQDKDFNVLPPTNSDLNLKTTMITIYNNQIDQQIINDLKKEFNVKDVMIKQPVDSSYDVLVILGDDYNQLQGKKLIN